MSDRSLREAEQVRSGAPELMDARRRRGSVEFGEFLADISHPGTGEILASRLSGWLRQSEDDLCEKWRSWQRGVPWSVFADRVLAVLEAAQDETCDMGMTIDWFLSKRLVHFDMQTPQEVILQGQGRLLILAVTAHVVPVP